MVHKGSLEQLLGELGALIQGRRMELGLSLNDVATAVGIPQSQLDEIEDGKHDPEINLLMEIVQYLGLDLSQALKMIEVDKREHPGS